MAHGRTPLLDSRKRTATVVGRSWSSCAACRPEVPVARTAVGFGLRPALCLLLWRLPAGWLLVSRFPIRWLLVCRLPVRRLLAGRLLR
jgi:hypothetical protein